MWVLDLEGERERSALVATPSIDRNAEVSPDGRWLAYQSNEAGQYEIYVASFPDVDRGGRRQLTFEGGTKPTWSPDGSELFFWNGAQMMAVDVETESSFSAGNPQVLFQAPYSIQLLSRNYDVSSDGDRFLMVRDPEVTNAAAVPQLVVVLNWFEELRERVPVD